MWGSKVMGDRDPVSSTIRRARSIIGTTGSALPTLKTWPTAAAWVISTQVASIMSSM